MSERDNIAQARRIVVKVGSSVLTQAGVLREEAFEQISRQIASATEAGREIVLVSSGAIAIGSRELGWSEPGSSVPEKQAAAAVGQIGLIELYRNRFAERSRRVGQILVTRAGLEDRERFLNARHTLLELLRLGVVPIVNENDTVATEEIRFGDNDCLSSMVVNLVGAELLVILTDVDGLYTKRPTAGEPTPELYDVVESITPEVLRAASGSNHAFGRGGMTTKLEAAEAAARSGAATIICNGLRDNVLSRALAGEKVGTLFHAGSRLQSRKHWLAYTARTRGELIIDEGAVAALRKGGRSLLPAGIIEARGDFRIGDAVACVDKDGMEIARGLVSYTAGELERIRGQATQKIHEVLGYSNGDEVIHRDDLVLSEDLKHST